MADTADRAAHVFVYGSCVARDTVEAAEPGAVDLLGYVARQSLLSIGVDASSHLPDDLGLASRFQERMVRADFAGSLTDRLLGLPADVDVLLWDLADERHGVHRFADGTIATRSIDTLRSPAITSALDSAELLEFGSDEHFELWRARADWFAAHLRSSGVFSRVVVLAVPWAVRTTEGDPSPWSMGVRAVDANRRYARYYAVLADLGFAVIRPRDAEVFADPSHRWGLAPFHYAEDVYREILGALSRRPGLSSLRPTWT